MGSDHRLQLPRLAIIGCGAAAREFFLPALRQWPGFRDRVVVVDSVRDNAEEVARAFGLAHHLTDYRELDNEIEAAIIATPHRLHAEQARYFLDQGKHVLVEKPLGMNYAEAEFMLQSAVQHHAILAVNNYRRLFPAYRRVYDILRSGELGEIRKITITDGTKFAWQSVSAFYLRDPKTRGVLLDRGAHTIDILCWWLGEIPRVEAASTDSIEHVEGLVDLQLTCRGIDISLKFSRFNRLENCYVIECDSGTIRGRLFDFAQFQIMRKSGVESVNAGEAQPHYFYAWQLTHSFVDAIQQQIAPLVVAADVAPSLKVIDEAYERALPTERPWYSADPNLAWLRGRQLEASAAAVSPRRESQR